MYNRLPTRRPRRDNLTPDHKIAFPSSTKEHKPQPAYCIAQTPYSGGHRATRSSRLIDWWSSDLFDSVTLNIHYIIEIEKNHDFKNSITQETSDPPTFSNIYRRVNIDRKFSSFPNSRNCRKKKGREDNNIDDKDHRNKQVDTSK